MEYRVIREGFLRSSSKNREVIYKDTNMEACKLVADLNKTGYRAVVVYIGGDGKEYEVYASIP